MSAISALPADIVTWLSAQSELSGICFMTEYPPTKKAIPLKSAIVAVGLEQVRIEDSFEENNEGVLVENEYCRLATLRIKLAIHIPFSQGGAMCHDVFTNIIDCLSFASDLDIIESGCSDITSDRDTDALVLNAWIDISANFCPAISSDLNFQSFLSKDLLCGSHIRDTTLHVSTAEKDRWNNAFTTGFYTGNGNSSKQITLDFEPRLVFIMAVQRAPVHPISGTSTYNVFSGVATAGYGSMGIEITATGFRALQGNSYAFGNCYPALNGSGITYAFAAFK